MEVVGPREFGILQYSVHTYVQKKGKECSLIFAHTWPSFGGFQAGQIARWLLFSAEDLPSYSPSDSRLHIWSSLLTSQNNMTRGEWNYERRRKLSMKWKNGHFPTEFVFLIFKERFVALIGKYFAIGTVWNAIWRYLLAKIAIFSPISVTFRCFKSGNS